MTTEGFVDAGPRLDAASGRGVWQDELKVATLTELWPAGVPVAEIDAALGGVGKNAIISKARALNLGPHPSGSATTWTEERIARAKALKAEGLTYDEIAADLGGIKGRGVKQAFETMRGGKALRVRIDWTEKDATLIRLWREGIGSAEIAHALGVSVGALGFRIEKLRKDGIVMPARSTARPGNEVNGRLLAGTTPKPARSVEPGMRALEIAANLPPTDDPFTPKGCRWPVGDPRAINGRSIDGAQGAPGAFGTFRFCQQAKCGHGSYCADHAAIATSSAHAMGPAAGARRAPPSPTADAINSEKEKGQ